MVIGKKYLNSDQLIPGPALGRNIVRFFHFSARIQSRGVSRAATRVCSDEERI